MKEWQEAFRQFDPDNAPLFAGFWAGLKNLTPPAQPPGVAKKTWATCEHVTPPLSFLAPDGSLFLRARSPRGVG